MKTVGLVVVDWMVVVAGTVEVKVVMVGVIVIGVEVVVVVLVSVVTVCEPAVDKNVAVKVV